MRARPSSSSKAQSSKGPSKLSGSPNPVLTVGIAAGGLVVAGALFAAIPKPDFYAKVSNISQLSVPEPLPAKKASVAYSTVNPAPAGMAEHIS